VTAVTAAIALRGVRKTFGDVVAVDDVSLDVGDGEFLTLLGPSGSGKTTVLRMVAGFEAPTAGTILLGGRDVTRVPAFERDVNTVFQDYALFPHMTVADNVGYGLKVKRVATAERAARVREALEGVRLGAYGDRRPSQLSGGQRQRVALARALVNRPRVLLLDEPLGALDLKLREEMQVELKSIQTALRITFVYVTHDQGEALSMSDRVAVFASGRIEQVGTPRDVYERPATAFVAGFVGLTNLFSGDVARRVVGRDGTWTLRPEHVRVAPAAGGGSGGAGGGAGAALPATVSSVQYLGADVRVRCDLDGGGTVVASGPSGGLAGLTVGQRVTVGWDADAAYPISPR
jgi:putative spermidine/putrescine transport system ATP-binding protein